jgi:hypothetical protein
VVPGGTTYRLQDVKALHSLSDNGLDMLIEAEHWVPGDPQNLWCLAQKDVYTINGNFRTAVVLFTPGSKQRELQLGWGDGQFLPASPISD